jgi:hypothetical protein
MAVPINNVPRRVVFAASGTGPYSFTFEILAAADIAVFDDDDLLTLTTDYTVTINLDGTGSVTLAAPPSGTQIAIVGNRTIQRISDFVTGGDFFANTLNTELDQQTIFAQQNAEGLSRALQAPQTDPTTIDMTLPRAADRAGKYLAFDVNGNPEPGDTAVEVAGVFAIKDDITTVAGISANVTTVAGNSANVTTVAGISGNVTTVAGISGNVTTVATNNSNVTAVAGNATNINTVAGISANVTTVAGNNANVTKVAVIDSDVTTVAGIDTDVSTVAGIAADVTAVAVIDTDVTTVAGSVADITTVAGVATDVAALGPIAADITTVAGIDSDVTAVAADATDIGTVATDIANVNTTATNIASVNTAAANITDIQNAASNASAAAASALAAAASESAAAASASAAAASFDAFDDIYLGAKSSDPTVDNDGDPLTTGDQYFNSVANELRVYNGSSWQAASVVGGTVNSITTASATITGGSINATTIGATTASTGAFTTLSASTSVTTPSVTNAGTLALSATGANSITLATNGSTRVTADSAGNLGLGVTPSAWFANTTVLQLPTAAFYSRSDTVNDSGFMTNAYRNASAQYIYRANGAATYYQQGDGAHYWFRAASGTAGNAITFTQAMTLDASGRLGIGTTSPQNLLHLNPASDTYALRIQRGAGDFQYLRVGMNSGNANFVSTGFEANLGTFRFSGSGTTAPDTLTEYCRITAGGDLLVGTTSSSPSSGVGVKVQSTGKIYCVSADSSNSSESYGMYSTGAANYRFYVGWGGTVFATNTTISAISDVRLKENIQGIDAGLDAVMALKPRKFDWKDGKGKDIKGDRGWIAQEFEEVFPDMVDEWKDPAPEGEEPYKSVRADLIPVLVKAIQEQQQLIESLTARITALEGNQP